MDVSLSFAQHNITGETHNQLHSMQTDQTPHTAHSLASAVQ